MAQIGFAQLIPEITKKSDKSASKNVVILDKAQISQSIYSRDRHEYIKINLPYVVDQPVSLEPYPVLSENIIAQYPDLRVYRYHEGDDHGIVTLTDKHIFISNNNINKPLTLAPDFSSDDSYTLITKSDEINEAFHSCGNVPDRSQLEDSESSLANTRDIKSFGTELRTYRLALVVTGEYYQANGNTNASVRAHAINSAANISDIFTTDLAVMFSVVDVKLNPDPNTDNFEPGQERTQQARNEIVAQYQNNEYDIGHVFHNHPDGGPWITNGQSGGVAQTPAVCIGFEQFKARGWSGAFDNNGVDWIQLAAHEFGHMFGANHTFNGSGDLACSGAVSSTTAYEIGSGTTIMSYNDLCDEEQNIPSSGAADGYFHVHSLLQMIAHIESTDCASISNSFSNNAPEIEINPCNEVYTIPRGTPFIMSAEGSDPDGDPLTYTWEQYDEDGAGSPTLGEIGTAASNNTTGPLFRSFPPTADISRSFPDINTVINGNTSDPFQALPLTSRTLNFKLTARDGNGGTVSDDRSIEVISGSSFSVTNPNTNITITAGNPLNVTWNAPGTEEVCSKVDIYLSLDGGFTTPYLLANDVDYLAGMTTVNIPSTLSETDKARVMIICDDNPCLQIFDISNSDFNISSGCKAEVSFICNTDAVSANQGSPSLDLDDTFLIGSSVNSTEDVISTSSTTMLVTVNGITTPCTQLGNYFYESEIITVDEDGDYTFFVDRDFENGSGFLSIFRENQFSESNGCLSFVGSSATAGETGGASLGTFATVTLEACESYVLVFYNYGPSLPHTTRISSISGPGNVVSVNPNNDTDYNYTFVAVNTDTEVVAATSPTADFTNLGEGLYQVYGVSYKTGGATPPSNTDPNTWPGQSITGLIFSGNCILQSQNSRSMEIISSCSIDGISSGNQESCDPANNEYSQDLTIEYSSAPTAGNLIVNGSSFPLSGSPQTVTLQNLTSDGAPVDVTVSFSADSSCERIFPAIFTAPENCCPITLDLGEDQNVCVDEMLILDAGPDGTTYEWTVNDIPLPDTEQTITPTSTGIYSVTVTNADVCAKTDEVSLVVNPNPVIMLNSNSSQCEGESATLNPNLGSTDFTYEWTRDGAFVAGSEIIEVTIPGEYCIVVTNPFSNCSSTACTTVEFIDAPNVELGDDLIGCEGDQFELDGGTDGSSYEWLRNDVVITNETEQTLTVTENGTYIVRVSEGLCTTSDTIDVELIPAPSVDFVISESFTLCEGTSETTLIQGTFDEYTITLDDTTVSMGTDDSYTIDAPGEYIITAVNAAGCTTSDTTTAIGSIPPVVNLGDDKIGCIGSEVLLNAGTDGAEYIWFLGTDLLTEFTSEISVNQSGQYIVIVSNDAFCTTTDTVNVDFLPGPTLDIGESFDLCEGQTQTVTADTNGDNITWFRDGVEIAGASDFTIDISESGTYLAEVAGTSGCAVEDQIVVNVFENPVVNIDPSRTICEGAETTVIAGADTNSYLWTDGVGTTVSQNPEFTTGEAGLYTVFITNVNNCFVSAQVEVIVTEFPTLFIAENSAYCEGSSTTLTVDGDADSYIWEKDNVEISGENSASIEVNEEGVYTVTGTNGTNCSSSVITTVTELANPSIDLGNDQDLCPGDNLMLTVSEAGTYMWSTGETDQTITIEYDDLIDTETTISAMLTTVDGCIASDEIVITRLTNPTPIVSEEETLCMGDTITLSVTASDGSSTDQYQWDGPTGTLSGTVGSSIEIFPNSDATYTVTVVNGCGVSDDEASTMVFIDQPAMDLSAGSDTCVIQGRSINLNATGGSSYEWDDNESFVGSTIGSNPEVMPTTETTYTVNITNDNGCTYRDEVTICIIEDPFSLIKPISLITPNDDGLNDVLEFQGLEAFPNNRLRIYNRWGVVIFDRAGYQISEILFDGNRAGEQLPPDTYYYILEIDDKVVYKQNLTIVRD